MIKGNENKDTKIMKTIKALSVFVVFFCALQLHAASYKYNLDFYDRWEELSGDDLLKKGYDFQLKGKLDSAMVCFTIVTNRYHENEGNKETKHLASKAMFCIGYIYMFYFYNYEQAYNYMQQSLELSEKEGFTENLPYIYLNLGNISVIGIQMNYGGNIKDDVMPMYRKAMYYAKKTKYWEAYIIIVGNILELAFESSTPKKYSNIVHEFLNMPIPDNTPRYKHVKYDCMALEAYISGNYKKAIELLDESRKNIAPNSSMERCEMRIFRHKGNIFEAMHEYDKAYKELYSAMNMAKKYQVRDGEIEFCSILYRLCMKMHNKEKAKEWLFMYYQKKDSLTSQSRIGNIDRLKFLNQIGKINKKVVEMSQKRKVEHAALCGLIAVVVSVVCFSIALYRKNRKLQERNHQIYRNSIEAIKREKEAQEQRYAMQKILDRMLPDEDTTPTEKKQKYQGSSLTDEEKNRLNNELLIIFDNMDEVCSENFSVNRLAELTGSTYKNVSQVINELHEKSFKQIVSTHRIREACRRLADKEHYGNLTIEGIAESVGFKSRSSFVQAFKREIGISPSEYQREAYHD